MTDRYRDDITKLIATNGAMGVNELQRALNVPLSTLQNYLTKQQNYFKKTENKKWDLPENVESEVKTNTLGLMANGAENAVLLLQSQMSEIQLSITNVLTTIGTLKRGVNNVITPPVADKASNELLNHRWISQMITDLEQLALILKKKMSDIPEEYHNLLGNTDWPRLMVERGNIYFKEELSGAIADLILKNSTELPDDVLRVLKEYGK